MGVKIQISGEFNPKAFAQAEAALAALQKQAIASSAGMAGSFMRAGNRLDTMGRKMDRAGKVLTRRVTLPAVALGALSVKAFADFDDAMTKSTSIMDVQSAKVRAALEKTARDVALTTKFSATQAAESYYFLASAGLDAAQSMKALPAVAKFATAGTFDMALATDLLTDAQSALGLTVKDSAANLRNMTKVSDVLVKANVLANATTEQFSESLTNKGAPALRLVNKDIEEGTALLAAWADQGVKGRIAGTYLAIFLRDLQSASIKNAEAWQKQGLAVYDASGRMRNTAEIIADLERKTAGLSDRQKKQFFQELGFTDKSFQVIASLLGKSDAIARYERELRRAGGTTEKVANKQMQSAKEQLRLLKDQFLDVGISLGGAIMPALQDFAKVLGDMARGFAGLSPGMKKFLIYAGLGAAALGPFLRVGGAFLRLAGAMAKGISKLIVRFGGLAAAETAAGAAGAKATAGVATGAGQAVSRVAMLTKGFGALAVAAGTLTAAWYAGKGIQSLSDKLAAATMGGQEEVEKYQSMSAARFGGKAAKEHKIKYQVDVEADTKRAEKAIQKAIEKLSVKAAQADPGKPFKSILKDIEALKALAESEIKLGDLNAKHTDGQLRSIRDRIASQLGVTRQRADRIMALMFKDWRPQKEVTPKINAAAAAAEKRVQTMAARIAGTKITFSDPNTVSVLNGIDRIIQRLYSLQGAARQAQQILSNLSAPRGTPGYSGGRPVVGSAVGRIVRQPMLSWLGEEGPEVVLPINRPRRMRQLLGDSGLLGESGGGGITLVGPFIGAPPDTWAAFVRAHAAEITELGFSGQSAAAVAAARG